MMPVTRRHAFTLIELLLTVGVIGTLSSIVIVAINPTQQLGKSADAVRNNAVNQFEKALNQYLIDNSSNPGDQSIPTAAGSAMQICRLGQTDAGCINMDELVPEFMPCMPFDGAETDANDTGYTVYTRVGRYEVTSLYVDQQSAQSGGCERPPQPLAYWPFDEGSGDTTGDASANGHDGTLTNMDAATDWVTDTAPTEFTNPYALDFDGSNDRVTVSSFDVTGSSITLAAWFKTTGVSLDSRIVSKATSTSADDHYWMFGFDSDTPNELRFRLHAGGSTNTREASSVETGTWTHFAAVYDGTTMQLYKDGSAVGSLGKTGDVRTGNVDVWIGDNQPQGSRPFQGILDEVRVYDAVLSPTQVSLLASGKKL